jgi:hypothetical protein
VFRIFDVWESEVTWNAFVNDRLMPAVQPLMEQGGGPRRHAPTSSTTSCQPRARAAEDLGSASAFEQWSSLDARSADSWPKCRFRSRVSRNYRVVRRV